jgi:hypothetical protein
VVARAEHDGDAGDPIGNAIGVEANVACGLFADAQFAAEGHDLELDDRVEAASRAVRARLPPSPAPG